MKILNLYSGVGGNRNLWDGDYEVTAVEKDYQIAEVYAKNFPQDRLVIGDAHEYLLDSYDKFDIIWSSPPCQTHSRMVKATRHKLRRFTDLSLYEEVMLLQDKFEGEWVVENVVPYYRPLIEPSFRVGRHLFWSSRVLEVKDVERPRGFINQTNLAGRRAMLDWLGMDFEEVIYYGSNGCPAQILRNAVHPRIGLDILLGLMAPSPPPPPPPPRKKP